jgi:glycosyltransferase involved in cell wall biosynthesis
VQGSRLKLLLVINHLNFEGGAEIQTGHLAIGLARLGHEVTVCSLEPATVDLEAFERAGVKIVSLGVRTRIGRLLAVPRIARLCRRADAVQCTMWDASLWGRLAAILARRPVVIADHATDRSIQLATSGASRARWIALHNRLLDRFTFATVACANAQRPVLLSEGVHPERIVQIANGVPIEAMTAAAAEGPSRGELGLPEDAPLAMQVAVFRPEKNQDGALEAFVEVRRRVPDAHLVFVGDGSTRPEVERHAEELGAQGWAHFLGYRDDVAAMISLADLILLPSIADTMPLTVLETIAMGVPTVATDVGDVRSTLGDAGVCVPAGDSGAFADACARLLSDPGLRAEMSAAARRRAGAYDLKAMARRYAALFEAARAHDPASRAALVPA